MLSRYIAKCKYTLKMIQILEKLDEVLSHILNMNWLYHFNYNWKVWFMWFHKKDLNKVFIQMSISVLKKNILLKNYFYLKMTRIMLYTFVSKTILFIYQNTRWNQRRLAPKIYQNIPKKEYIFFDLKQPYLVCFHPLFQIFIN
jgi:hypothetical protein